MLPTDLAGLIIFLGTTAFVTMVSDWLEYQPWFQGLSSQFKNYTVIILSVLLALLSRFLQTAISPDAVAQIDPWYAVAATAINYVVSQLWHNAQHDDGTKG
jgi:hypothetical protein